MGKSDILDQVRELATEQLSSRPFVPGKTYIPASYPDLAADDVVGLVDTALGYWYTEYGKCNAFAEKLRKYIGMSRCVLTNSGSSASLLAMRALVDKYRVGVSRYVITTATGFPTTVAPIYQCGLEPIYIDIDPFTLEPVYDQMFDAIDTYGDEIIGAVFAHALGFPYNEEYVSDVLMGRGKFLLSDCCDALGAGIGSRGYVHHVGTFSDAMTLSFFPAHHINTAEGGAVLMLDEYVEQLVDSYRSWGRNCFPAGTMITMDGYAKPIEDVCGDDRVIDAFGRPAVVERTFVRSYSGKLYTISARKKWKVSATSEHPFLVLRGGDFVWVRADELSVGDELVEAVPFESSNPSSHIHIDFTTDIDQEHRQADFVADYDLCKVMGYYLSQGSLAHGLKGKSGYSKNKYNFYRTDFVFASSKSTTIADLVRIMRDKFGCSPAYRVKQGATVISFKSRMAYEFFLQMCGVHSWEKSIHQSVMRINSNILIGLVDGFTKGDGNKNFQGYFISSCNLGMIEQLRSILLRCGIIASISTRRPEQHKSSVVNGNVVRATRNLYTLQLYGKNAEVFADMTGDDYRSRSAKQAAHIAMVDGTLYSIHKVIDVAVLDVNDLPVYNLEVRGSHTYHANGIAVHNCSCKPGQSGVCGHRFDHPDCDGLPEGWDHKYLFGNVGYNLKPTEFMGAMGVSQMDRLREIVDKRLDNFAYLRDNIRDPGYYALPGLSFQSWQRPSPFGFPILVGQVSPYSAAQMIAHLEQHKIGTRRVFAGNITRQPGYRDLDYRTVGDLDGSDMVMENMFWISVSPSLTREMRDYMVEVINDFFRKCE